MAETVYVTVDKALVGLPPDCSEELCEAYPRKAHATDAGYDVSVFKVHQRHFASHVTVYDTGLRLRPHTDNVYFELVARSSLFKRGYMLVNNVGVIDNGYRGPILVALYKFNRDAPDLELPARVAQLIPRTMVPVAFVPDRETVSRQEKNKKKRPLSRGEGGFGSTD